MPVSDFHVTADPQRGGLPEQPPADADAPEGAAGWQQVFFSSLPGDSAVEAPDTEATRVTEPRQPVPAPSKILIRPVPLRRELSIQKSQDVEGRGVTAPSGLVRTLCGGRKTAAAQPAVAVSADEPLQPPRGFFVKPEEPTAGAIPATLPFIQPVVATGEPFAANHALFIGTIDACCSAVSGDSAVTAPVIASNSVQTADPSERASNDTKLPPSKEVKGAKTDSPQTVLPPAVAQSDHVRQDASTVMQAPTVDRTEIAQRCVELFEQAAQHDRPFRVRLHPAELGALQVEISREDDGVTARLQVETAAALKTLTRHLTELRHALARHGVAGDRIEIQLTDFRETGEAGREADPEQHREPPLHQEPEQSHNGGESVEPRRRREAGARAKRVAAAGRTAADQVDIQI